MYSAAMTVGFPKTFVLKFERNGPKGTADIFDNEPTPINVSLFNAVPSSTRIAALTE